MHSDDFNADFVKWMKENYTGVYDTLEKEFLASKNKSTVRTKTMSKSLLKHFKR